MFGLGMLSLLFFSTECPCAVPRTPVVMVMRGFNFHPLFSTLDVYMLENLLLVGMMRGFEGSIQ